MNVTNLPLIALTNQTPKGETMTTATTLPALTGSEKQIDWATRIRADLLANRMYKPADGFSDDAAELAESFFPTLLCHERPAGRRAVLSWIMQQTDARWWIDNRRRSMSAEFDPLHVLATFLSRSAKQMHGSADEHSDH